MNDGEEDPAKLWKEIAYKALDQAQVANARVKELEASRDALLEAARLFDKCMEFASRPDVLESEKENMIGEAWVALRAAIEGVGK